MLAQDLRYTFRTLSRRPGFTLLVILTLALGIGATSALLSVADAVLFSPLPYRDPEQLVFVSNRLPRTEVERAPVSGPDFLDYQKETDLFSGFAGIVAIPANLTGGGDPEPIQLGWASPSFFSLLGVRLALGEMYRPEDEGRTGVDVLNDPSFTPPPAPVILSHDLWRRRYQGDPGVLGRTVQINGQSMVIRGVAPAGFQLLLPADSPLPRKIDAWSPFPVGLGTQPREAGMLTVIARLKPGVFRKQAQAQMDRLAAELRRQSAFHASTGLEIRLQPMHAEVVRHVRPVLLPLLGTVAFVLLIACANVANLLLVRMTARDKELGVRAALGGPRGRLLAQTLTETGTLALLGGAAGVALAAAGVRLLLALKPENLPRVEGVAIDGRVLLATFGITVAAALLFGLAPALQASRRDLADSLRERSSTGGPRRQRLHKALVVIEIALSLTLLVGAGLLLRSFVRLQRVDPGFRPDKVLTAKISLPIFKYPQPERRADFFAELSRRVAALPGVRSVGAITPLPLDEGGQLWRGNYLPAGGSDQDWSRNEADYRLVLPGYFETLGTRLLDGRTFTEADNRPGAPPVSVVDAVMARKTWPGLRSPVGQRLKVARVNAAQTGLEQAWTEVVGVVEHARFNGIGQEGRQTIYFPHRFWPFVEMTLTVRTEGDPLALAGPLRARLKEMDPDLPIVSLRAMSELVDRSLAPTRFALTLLALFAALALVLAAVGHYGVMAYSVRQRTREMGIRLAFGAPRQSIFGLVVGQAVRLALVGIVLGLAAAIALGRTLSSLLFGVTATDPLTFVLCAALLLAVSLLAGYLPALRATRVDPTVPLQAE